MRAKDIEVGGCYWAKVNGRLVTVRVEAIRQVAHIVPSGRQTVYDVTNLTTARRTTFRSAAKFRSRNAE